ncbi:methyl-accepting chemotaxis protein [Methylophaga sp. OBS1]|uniref:methyl-accepting chemotaxis protein n=1 Tax=Methylophaga sp. OBS1 TaxID=2991933 RepID=UPI0022506406|nr:methyl-accepting chemotaxis protein [Methylophaga sp. OBS1]MCX4191077.1 methyl-accepting chemotaxis protein [Methylophaga sp. OBS1]MCX4191977.1 methyl-accepting chemotaxis protein [Methylophaga sp. OBS1]
MKKNLPVTDNEVTFEEELISTTDLKGAITGFNAAFEEVSGFPGEEMLGKNHNIIRHPDMPPAAFEDLWNTVKAKDHWMGIVKNRRKDGDFYWVDAYVTPIFDRQQIVGYESVRIPPKAEYVKRAQTLYQQINAGKKPRLGNVFSRFGLKHKTMLSVALVSLLTMLASQLNLVAALPFFLPMIVPVLVGAGTYALLHKWVFASLDRALKEARKEVNNPLMAMVYTGNNDEIAQLSLVNKLAQAKLNTVLVRLRDTAGKIDTEARDTFSSQQSIMESIQSQASQTEQVATAMTEMSSSIQEVSSNASKAASTASEVDELTKSSERKASTAVNSLGSLDTAFSDINSVISELEDDSNAINPIIGVISDIAEQTNLLALNAAIEAARAGEYGRGFAVVADEVRSLASRTQQSTQEISGLIQRLDQAVDKVVAGMKKTQETASSSREDISASITSVSIIKDKVQELNDLNTQIATAVEEQSAVSDDINRNVVRISSDAESVVSNANLVNTNAENLAGESTALLNMIRRFSQA